MGDRQDNVVTEGATFQMKINPEKKRQSKSLAADQLMMELQKGLDSFNGERGWISESDTYRSVGVEE